MNSNLHSRGSMSVLFGVSSIAVLLSLFLGSHIYLNYKIKTSHRFAEAYRLISVFEEAAKILRTARDTSPIVGGMLFPPPNPACANACLASGGVAPQMCFPHPTNLTTPYCIYAVDLTVRNAHHLHFNISGPQEIFEEPSASEQMIAYLENQFRGAGAAARSPISIAQILSETLISRAEASTVADVITMRNDLAGAAPLNCDPAAPAPGCLTCGGANPYGAGLVTCVTLNVCPKGELGCTGPGAPGIMQSIFLIPAGYQR